MADGRSGLCAAGGAEMSHFNSKNGARRELGMNVKAFLILYSRLDVT